MTKHTKSTILPNNLLDAWKLGKSESKYNKVTFNPYPMNSAQYWAFHDGFVNISFNEHNYETDHIEISFCQYESLNNAVKKSVAGIKDLKKII